MTNGLDFSPTTLFTGTGELYSQRSIFRGSSRVAFSLFGCDQVCDTKTFVNPGSIDQSIISWVDQTGRLANREVDTRSQVQANIEK